MCTSPNPSTLSLRKMIVCHADILGFKDFIEDAFDSCKPEERLATLKSALDAAYKEVREWQTPDCRHPSTFEMKVFTDNIVIAYPYFNHPEDDGESELGRLLMLLAHVQAGLASSPSEDWG